MKVDYGSWTNRLQTGQYCGQKGVSNIDTRWMTSDPIALTPTH